MKMHLMQRYSFRKITLFGSTLAFTGGRQFSLATITAYVAREKKITKLIETSIKIIAVDQVSDSGRSAPMVARTVTVEVSPQQVAALAQAATTGRLSLSLVGAEDDSIASVEDVDQRLLLGLVDDPVVEAPAPVAAAEPKRCTMKMRRGGAVVFQEIPCSD